MPATTVNIPKKLLKNYFEAHDRARSAADELEDFLLLNDPEIKKQIEGSKKDFAAGKRIPFSKL